MQRVQLEKNIACFSWNAARDQVAVSPHTNELHIYSYCAPDWKRLHTFVDHDQVVSGVHWGPVNDRIATCSHDRNVFVYARAPQGTGWQQQLVRTRIAKAALCVQWAPGEAKLAVGSSDSGLHVAHYDAVSRWWVTRAIKRRHSSSLVALAWHPTQPLVATASTDGTCRLFTAALPEVDGKPAPGAPSGFGQQVWEGRADGSWLHGVAWHPRGTWLACCSHGGGVHLYRAPSPATQERHHAQADAVVEVGGLPLKVLHFTDAGLLAAGWGGGVHLLQQQEGQHGGSGWRLVALEPASGVDAGETCKPAEGGAAAANERISSRVAGVQQELKAQQLGGARSLPSSPRGRPEAHGAPTAVAGVRAAARHTKCVVALELVPAPCAAALECGGGGLQVVSAGLDGRLLFWDLPYS